MKVDVSRSALIIGCGDIGARVAAIEQGEGATVAALARSGAAAQRLCLLGLRPCPGDLDRPESLGEFPPVATLYYFAPPPPEGASDPRIRALLAALHLASLPDRLVYISTSGVYGDCGGAWVDEDWPPNPQTGRARRRLDAETAVRAFGERTGVAWTILRVPGIYGPGRLPVERLRQGLPILREAESPFSNRIHADDLAAVCVAAARRAPANAVYNASDGHPTSMSDYFNRVADFLGLPRPPAVSLAEARQALTPAMLSFLEESKRLDNRRMLAELGIRLRYPTLEKGLPACVA